jgi:serine protease AprX
MAKKRVTAFYMHEAERNAAESVMTSTLATDSFAVGEIEESDIARLQAQGVIIKEDTLPTTEEGATVSSFRQSPSTFSFAAGKVAELALNDALPAAVDFYTIVLRGPLLEPWRQRLDAAGITLISRERYRTYKARLTAPQVTLLNSFDFVESVTWITPAQATPLQVTQSVVTGPGLVPTNGLKMLTFDVRLHLPADRAKIVQWLQDHNVTISGASGRKIRFFALENASVLTELALLPEVDVIAEFVEPTFFNDLARSTLGVETTKQSPSICISQDGAGQIVAVADTGIDDKHPDFKGRIVGKAARGRVNDTTDPAGHGTHVSGSILGDGSASGGQYKGIAPKANLFFQSLLDSRGGLGGLPLDLNDLFEEAYQAGARIHNNSWGANYPSVYTINSEEVDEFVRKNPDMLIVVAAGNAGSGASPKKAGSGFVDWLSIGSPASCKNALTVGASRSTRTNGPLSKTTWGQGWPGSFPLPPIANENISGDPECLAAFSSRGPCDDRRIKPDLVAPGTEIISAKSSLAPASNFWGIVSSNPQYAYDGGTSMATPLVSGCAALVRQHYVEERNHQPSAALLKATLINSTQWLQGADSTAPTKGVPNYHQGHGRIDMRRALPNVCNPGYALQFIDNWQMPNYAFTRTGERKRYQFVLAGNIPELRICMAYTDAPARALQNNLNLMVQHVESNTKWMGNQDLPDALTIPDPDNNVEAIKVTNAPQGTYYIQIFVGNMLKPPQDFALVVAGVNLPSLNEI